MAAVTKAEATATITIQSSLNQSLEKIEEALKQSALKTHSVETPFYNAGMQAHTLVSSLQVALRSKATCKLEDLDQKTQNIIWKVNDIVSELVVKSPNFSLIANKVALIIRNSPLCDPQDCPLLTDVDRSITNSTREIFLKGDFSYFKGVSDEKYTYTFNGKKYGFYSRSDEEISFLVDPLTSKMCQCITGELNLPDKTGEKMLTYRTFHCVVHIPAASLTESDKKEKTKTIP